MTSGTVFSAQSRGPLRLLRLSSPNSYRSVPENAEVAQRINFYNPRTN